MALAVPKYIDDFLAMLVMKNALLRTNVSTFLEIFFWLFSDQNLFSSLQIWFAFFVSSFN